MSGLAAALEALHATLESRKGADPKSSYVAQLYGKGLDVMLKKLAEESGEVLIAAKNGDRAELVHEAVDLLFHLFVLLADQDIAPADLAAELDRRSGRSGLDEKASRGT